jgi:hypothetical protein
MQQFDEDLGGAWAVANGDTIFTNWKDKATYFTCWEWY